MATSTPERKRHPRARALLIWGGLLAVVLVGALLLSQRDNGEEPPPVTGLVEEAPVQLTLEAEVLGDTLLVHGTTNLPDGSLLSYEIHQVEDPQLRWHAEGHAQVAFGAFSERIDIGDWPGGDVEVFLSFPSALGGVEQPEEAVERFGERGERLTGSNVVEYDDGNRIEKIAVVQHRPEQP